MCFMAATSFSRRFYSWNRVIRLEGKKTAALISQKPPFKNKRVKIPLLDDGFFSFAVVRQINFLFFFYEQKALLQSTEE